MYMRRFLYILLISTIHIALVIFYIEKSASKETQFNRYSSESIESNPIDQMNHFCLTTPLIFNNRDAMLSIETELKKLAPRFEKCSSKDFDIDSLIQVIRNDSLVGKSSDSQEALTLKLNINAIETNFNLSKDDKDLRCWCQRFEKKLNSNERLSLPENLGTEMVFESGKNYEIKVNDSGFFYLNCWLQNNKTQQFKVFDYVYIVLPTDMQRLVPKRTEFKRKINLFLKNLKFDDRMGHKFKNTFINDDCPSNKSYGLKDKMNVLMIGLDSLSQAHFERVFPLTFKFVATDLQDSLRLNIFNNK
jgi:hypothetical protein